MGDVNLERCLVSSDSDQEPEFSSSSIDGAKSPDDDCGEEVSNDGERKESGKGLSG